MMPQEKDTRSSNAGSRGCNGECRGWAAWYDRLSGAPGTLHVVGTCRFPTPGYTVQLIPREPQGIDPAILLLDRVVTPPDSPQPDVLTDVDVQYREKTAVHYREIKLLPGGPTLPVREVS